MKKKLLIGLACIVMLTGCGAGNSKSEDYMYFDAISDEAPSNMEIAGSSNSADNTYNYKAEEAAVEEYDAEENYSSDASASNSPDSIGGDSNGASNTTSTKIKNEMLVYRGNINIDTLDFQTSINDFKALLNLNNGFVFDETFSDNKSTSGYYRVDKDSTHKTYNATVRVPSDKYEAIMSGLSSLGDVRNQNSQVTNVTQQYSTYTSRLEVYETEYKRYLSLLEKAQTDEASLEIQDKLFDLQLQIADLKSQIGNIEMDVAYSYITISIREVEEYVVAPAPTDTFFDRLKITCQETLENLRDGSENLLFWAIRNVVGIIIFAIISIITLKTIRKKLGIKKNKKNKKNNSVANEDDNSNNNITNIIEDTTLIAADDTSKETDNKKEK